MIIFLILQMIKSKNIFWNETKKNKLFCKIKSDIMFWNLNLIKNQKKLIAYIQKTILYWHNLLK